MTFYQSVLSQVAVSLMDLPKIQWFYSHWRSNPLREVVSVAIFYCSCKIINSLRQEQCYCTFCIRCLTQWQLILFGWMYLSRWPFESNQHTEKRRCKKTQVFIQIHSLLILKILKSLKCTGSQCFNTYRVGWIKVFSEVVFYSLNNVYLVQSKRMFLLSCNIYDGWIGGNKHVKK